MIRHCDTMDVAVAEGTRGLRKVRTVRISLSSGSHQVHVDMDEELAREFLRNLDGALRVAVNRTVQELAPRGVD